jgi:hypothetical protein
LRHEYVAQWKLYQLVTDSIVEKKLLSKIIQKYGAYLRRPISLQVNVRL